tara:strand:- start:735 stop:1034 length:300 start_codon:yes stop_codon:yes gene_type:complete
MRFNELKFVNGVCQLDYNYYVLSITQISNQDLFECTIFNRAKLPVDLPGIKTEKIKNNKWVKISLCKKDVEKIIKTFWAITGIQKPIHLEHSQFYKNIF